LADASRSIRISLECSVAEFRELVTSAGSVEDRRPLVPMVTPERIRISPIQPNR